MSAGCIKRMKRTHQVRTNIAILSVIGLAVIVTALSIRQAQGPWFRPIGVADLAVLIAMLALVIAMDLVQISLPQSKFVVAFTVSGTVFVAATIAYGAIVGVILAAIGTLVTEWFLKKQLRKLVFNAAQYVCAAGLAGLLYHSIVRTDFRPPLSSAWTIVVALLSAAVYLFINAALVSTIVAVDIGKSPIQVFMANIPGLLMQNITLFSIGLLVTTVRDLSPLALFIALLPLLGPYLAMRGHRDTQMQIRKTIEALADTVDRRDTSTAQHSERVAIYTQQIIDELGTIRFAEAEAIILAARVHDLGKIAIPDAVLLKPGRLDEGEYWLMRQHPVAGDDILQQLAIYKDSLGVVRHHHEKYDGSGYPDGIKGDTIPLGARIVSVADSYDVMTSDRPYARARSIREAKDELLACKGTHFDPKIVDAFVRILDRQHSPVPAERALAGATHALTPSA
jgi:HD-GYP domain-containing protein (c-di-GMP phosphodiesterase class II)